MTSFIHLTHLSGPAFALRRGVMGMHRIYQNVIDSLLFVLPPPLSPLQRCKNACCIMSGCCASGYTMSRAGSISKLLQLENQKRLVDNQLSFFVCECTVRVFSALHNLPRNSCLTPPRHPHVETASISSRNASLLFTPTSRSAQLSIETCASTTLGVT